MLGNNISKKIDIVIYYKNKSIGTQTVNEEDVPFFYHLHMRKENVVAVKMFRHQEVKLVDGKRPILEY